jgi:hypothetical protein
VSQLRAALREFEHELDSPGYLEFCESPAFCGLELTPVMRAIALASEGRTVSLPDTAKFFGCPASKLPDKPRLTVAVRAGGRGGKSSRLVATKALHAAWTVALPTLAAGEFASSLIVAPDMNLGRQTLSFVKGYIDESPVLSGALIRTPRTDDVEIVRPDGKPVRIQILPASAKGAATRGRVLVFCGMDEAAFFRTGDDRSVTDTDIYRAVRQRIAPGAQVWIVSTPWLAHSGLLEKTMDTEWGRHENALCVTAGTRDLNPTWDPDGNIERGMRANDPDGARVEIDGLPLPGSASAFFDPAAMDACIDSRLTLPRVPQPGDRVSAAADMGFQRDYSALAVVHHVGDTILTADLLELRPEPDKPLKPSVVVRTFADRVQQHSGVRYLVADAHYRESVREVLGESGLGVKDAPAGASGVAEVYVRARALLREGRVRIPEHPRLLSQLRAIQWRPNVGGTISILKPRGQGGHCDLADAWALALWEAGGFEIEKPKAPAERAWKAHWDPEQEGLDPWEKQDMEDAERAVHQDWQTALIEESYGLVRR